MSRIYSVVEFCQDHRISRTHLYQLWKEGKGPRRVQVGKRRLITEEAAVEWFKSMETGAEPPQAQRKQTRPASADIAELHRKMDALIAMVAQLLNEPRVSWGVVGELSDANTTTLR
jgi:predicted DNA-binding transcriptional regulator AlpA